VVFEPGAASRLGGHAWQGEPTGALRADMGDNQLAVVYDARGNGNGEIVNTITGDHENRVTDYTAIVLNERQHALTVGEDVANTLTGTDFKGTQCVFEPKTLKIRSGCEGGGKGALVQDNKSATLSCNNDQTVFVPKPAKKTTYDVRQTSDGTVNARCHAYDSEVSRALDCGGNVPGSNHGGIAVVDEFAPKSAAFMGGQGANAGSIAYSEDIVPTIRSQAGGNSVPMVMSVYDICSQNSNSMKSGNPHSGIYETEVSRTLDTGACSGNGGQVVVYDGKQITSKDNRSNPQPGSPCHTLSSGSADSAVCVQGSMIGRADKNGPQGSGVNDDVSFTLTEADRHAVCYQDKIGSLCASDCKFPQQQQINEGKAIVERVAVENYQHSGYRESETAGTLKQCGGTNGGGSENVVIENRYVVRRLTPTECALLQGFPPDWCAGLETPEPTGEDIAFWSEVFETQRNIIGTSSKPKSRRQIEAWLKDPYSDAAAYKMWGNGVALPCVVFILGGIVFYAQNKS
jgi:DNA (cytosine-5)-methyltransferase 1